MPEIAIALYVAFLLLAFGWRTWLQWRRTGASGFHGISGRPGSAEWLGGVLFVVALVLAFVAPILALADVHEPLTALDRTPVHLVGLVLAVGGIAATLIAQVAMGNSWRIGVDPDDRTSLVMTGPFAIVRNPIFAAMLPAALGLALMVPSVAALVGALGLLIAVELQVRVVEEPYLSRTHGAEYLGYAGRVGRFLPGIGRLSS